MAFETITRREVHLKLEDATLHGDLTLPPLPQSLVIFAHGSGSSRLSPRNRMVASTLQDAGHATLLLDLLTEKEEEIDRQTRELRFDILLLARRVGFVADRMREDLLTRSLPIGLFGASTGAAAALIASSERPWVAAVVSRGGRPDLALDALPRVVAPTLLIVGERDREVGVLNEKASAQLGCYREVVVIPRATHLFEEPGALEHVARLSAQWFSRWCRKSTTTNLPTLEL